MRERSRSLVKLVAGLPLILDGAKKPADTALQMQQGLERFSQTAENNSSSFFFVKIMTYILDYKHFYGSRAQIPALP